MADLSDVEKKIIRQVEYYFGDANLPRDRFLQEQIKEDEGWVTLETMTKFNRLKQICDDTKAIAEALKKSTSGLIEVHEDNTKIRRNTEKPLPENNEKHRQEMSARTVYAKEFPLDSTLDNLQEFFETHGEVDSLYMRRNEKKAFKGSVFVTFKKLEDVEKFLKAESVKYNDKELESRKLKTDYYKAKQEEKKKIQDEKQAKRDKAKNRQEEDGQKKIENEMTKGAMLHLKGFSEETTREDIKNLLQDYGAIAWVDFNKGDKEGWIRYDEENKAKDVLEKVSEAMNNEITLNGNKLEGRVLEGEEEVERWKKMFNDIRERMQQNRRKNSRFGRRPDKGRFGKRPSKKTRDALKAAAQKENDDDGGSDDGNVSDDEPPAKKAKEEEVGGD